MTTTSYVLVMENLRVSGQLKKQKCVTSNIDYAFFPMRRQL
jgi:hypothetical protein